MTNIQQDRYILEKRLGAGAMGEVWLAQDTLLGRPVAIKYLKATDDDRVKELFLAEARTLAQLNHPNVTQIYDAVFDERQNRFFILMEYVQGQALADIIKGWKGPLPLEIVLEITIGIVEALEMAHRQGFVHRDIKPANVLVKKEGVKLTDFGIAGLMSLLAEGSDFIAGTPAYMPPEQIEGLPVDGRADLYSLGIMLYEMVSGGTRPFMYTTQTKLFMAHLEELPPNLKDFTPEVPFALERVIMRLLEKEAENRFVSATELLEVLTAIRARERFSHPYLQLLEPDTKPLLGRQAELNQLAAAWERVQAQGRSHLVVVQGPPGCGKTKLITDFVGNQVVDQGAMALAGRCHEAGLPYAPFAEILGTIFNRNLAKPALFRGKIDQLLAQIPSLARVLNLSETEASARAEASEPKKSSATSTGGLWQALTERMPESTPRDFSDSQWQFSKIILDILTDLGPVAIFLEDAIYLDEASVTLIRFLIRQSSLPLLLVAACRDGSELPGWLSHFTTSEMITIALPALSSQTIELYLARLIDGPVAPEVVGLVEERSQGIPFQIETVAQQLLETGQIELAEDGSWRLAHRDIISEDFMPKSVLGAFKRQIDKLKVSSRTALAVAALIEPGPEFDLDLWLALLRSEAVAVSGPSVLEEALKKRLVRKINEKRYAFRPPDVAKALIATLTGTRRLDLHNRIAEILHQQGADPLLVSHHYQRAGEIRRAADYLEAAAARATTANALNTALTYYNHVAALTGSRSAYRAIGHLHRQQGHHSEAIQAYQRTLILAREAGDALDEARTLNSLALTLCLNDQYQAAHQQAEQVMHLDHASATARAIAQSHLGLILWLSGRLNEAEKWGRQAINQLSGRENRADLAEAQFRLGQIHTSQGKFEQARLAFQQALQIRREVDDGPGQAYCLTGLGRLVAERGDFQQAEKLLSTAQDIFSQNQARDGLILVFANRGRILCEQNQAQPALPFLTKALDIAKEIGERSAHIIGEIYLLIARASLLRDNLKLAKSAAADALKVVEAAGNLETTLNTQLLLARIQAAQNDLPAAEKLFKNTMAQFEQIGSRPGLIRTQHYYAQFLGHRPDRAAEAAALRLAAAEAAGQLGLHLPQ